MTSVPLDPMTEEFFENYQPPIDHLLNSLDGDVNSQGIKVKHQDWLVIGSDTWSKTPERIKAYAYQAAKVRNWTDETLSSLIAANYNHLTPALIKFAIDDLKSLAEKFPAEVIEEPSINPPVEVKVVRHQKPLSKKDT